LPLRHLPEDVALSLRQVVERGMLAPRLLGDERLDDLRIDDRSSLCHGPDRRHELADVADALLEQIRASLCSGLEKRERVRWLQVLAEHDHADVWMLHA